MSFLPDIPGGWLAAIKPFLPSGTLEALEEYLQQESTQFTIYPPRERIFRALEETPLASVKAVILGQDPYHEPGQACGLSFAVPRGTPFPPSLINILKEYTADLGVDVPKDCDVSVWASRGVLMLNTVLTVRANKAASHQGHGWELVTDAIIRAVNARETPAVFLLWGGHAAKKQSIIDAGRHVVITSAHPSPLSAFRGFFGSKPFSKINESLKRLGISEIDWSLEHSSVSTQMEFNL